MQSSRHGPLTRSSARAGGRLTYAGPWHAGILCTQQPALLELDRMCMAHGMYRQQPLSRRRSPSPYPLTSSRVHCDAQRGRSDAARGGRAAALMPRGACWVQAPSLIKYCVRASRIRPAQSRARPRLRCWHCSMRTGWPLTTLASRQARLAARLQNRRCASPPAMCPASVIRNLRCACAAGAVLHAPQAENPIPAPQALHEARLCPPAGRVRGHLRGAGRRCRRRAAPSLPCGCESASPCARSCCPR